MIDVHCYNRQRIYRNRDTYPIISETAEHVLYHSPAVQNFLEDGVGISIDITLVGPRTMRRINREHRGVDAETDILSFPSFMMHRGIIQENIEEWQFVDIDGAGRPSLDVGELVISPGRVALQAQELGHSFERELRFLVIHGVLHLLGYDHEEEDDEGEMVRLQKELLADLEEIPCGFVALAGRTNVGKSTLLNKIAGRTLAITTAKPQTTRHSIRSVYTANDCQIAFIDTPGVHRPKTGLGRAMMRSAVNSIHQADVVVLMIDASWRPVIGAAEQQIIEQARKDDKPIILVLNKVDSTRKENVLPLIEAYEKAYRLDAYIPMSAKYGDGTNRLIEEIRRLLPVQRRLFSADDETDQTERILAGELIRREVLLQTDQEIPYGVTVLVEAFEEVEDIRGRFVAIDAVILCNKESHKQILVGKGGSKIKSIGIAARSAIESLLEAHVDLSLFVKVRRDWQNRAHYLRESGISER
jgi:GTP-binding protein Era